MSATEQMTGADVWHNPCCLALMDVPEEDRPVTWVCDTCGADWRYDVRSGAYGQGFGPYWQAQSARETASALRSISRGIERLEKYLGKTPPTVLVDRPALSRWQHLKKALLP